MTDKTGIWWTQALWISWQVLYSLSYVVPALEPVWPSYIFTLENQHQLGFSPSVGGATNEILDIGETITVSTSPIFFKSVLKSSFDLKLLFL